MGGRSETHNYEAGLGIPEPRHGPTPVLLGGKRCTLLRCNLLAPLHQTWTAAAHDYLIVQKSKGFGAHH
jgi:hypothetical protein